MAFKYPWQKKIPLLTLTLLLLLTPAAFAAETFPLVLESIRPEKAELPMADSFYPLQLRFSGTLTAEQAEQAQVKITLMDAHGEREISRAGDPVVASFLGESREDDTPLSWPSELTGGSLMPLPDQENQWIWGPFLRREVGLFLHSAGHYTVQITLKVGGQQQVFQAPFTVTGKRVVGEGIFGLVGSTLRILAAKLPHEKAVRIETQIQTAITEHQSDKAAEILGREMRALFDGNSIHTLGRYVTALGSSSASDQGIVLFLESFLRGYRQHGVTLIVKEGLDSWNFFSSRGLALTAAPDTLNAPQSRARIFESERLLVIPYRLGETITLNIQSSVESPFVGWDLVPGRVDSSIFRQSAAWSERFVIQPGGRTFRE